MRRICWLGIATVVVIANAVGAAHAHDDGYHHMVVKKNSNSYGIQRHVKVTNPDLGGSTYFKHLVVPLWWIESPGNWVEIGWGEWTTESGQQIYTWVPGQQDGYIRYNSQYPIQYGDTIHVAIVPDSECPQYQGENPYCLMRLRLKWDGVWQTIRSFNISGTNLEEVHMGFEYYHDPGSGHHGELAGSPSNYEVPNYDAQLRSSSGTWSAWNTQPATPATKSPYAIDVTTQWTDLDAYCSGSCP